MSYITENGGGEYLEVIFQNLKLSRLCEAIKTREKEP